MKRTLLVCITFLSLAAVSCNRFCTAQGSKSPDIDVSDSSMSFIVVGDVHYCDTDFYDLPLMETEKPGDYRQITATYAPVTEANWLEQIAVLKQQIKDVLPPVKCIVQLGDISEGLANSEGKADAMAQNMAKVLDDASIGVPWVLTKGNHDITGVGEYKNDAKSAFTNRITPFIRSQVGNPNIDEANYVYRVGEVLFVVLDAYTSEIDQTAFAKSALENSDAKYKFVCMHDPAIPASERCWHYLRSKPVETREAFLKVLAENKAIFLCGHLHRYSVLRRNTEWGPIIQVMTTSVTSVKRKSQPSYQFSTEQYGPGLVDWKADWTPSTAEARKATLTEEAKYVDYYKMNNLPGYGVISVDTKKEEVVLRYYAVFETEPYDEINLTKLMNRK